MATLLERASGRRRVIAIAVLAGLAASLVASFTHPFTLGADIVTAIPLCLGAVVLVRGLHTERRSAVERQLKPSGAPVARRERGAWCWLALVTAIISWELYCYFSMPRSAHPTLSVLIDSLEATQTGKGVAFLLWLALGWYLVVS